MKAVVSYLTFFLLLFPAEARACFYTFGPLGLDELVEKAETIWVGELHKMEVSEYRDLLPCGDWYIETRFEIETTLMGQPRTMTQYVPLSTIDGQILETFIVFSWTNDELPVAKFFRLSDIEIEVVEELIAIRE